MGDISLKKGKGAIAIRNISRGELLVTEKPVLECNSDLRGNHASLVAALATYFDKQFAALSPGDQEKVMSLHDCWGEQKTVAGIYCTNAVSRGSGDSYDSCGVLCPMVSRFNHSCSPNATFHWRDQEGYEVV